MAKSGASYSNATFVTRGYGQVEPNFLTAPQNGQVFAQLPAAADIEMLENGQFVKYDMVNGECNFTGTGPWRMVFNEVKVYREREGDADFAMIRDSYNARVYSPLGQSTSDLSTISSELGTYEGTSTAYDLIMETFTYPAYMPDGTKMVPRVLGIAIGDWWTTNTIMADPGSLSVGDDLMVGEDGYLTAGTGAGGDDDPQFKVVKVYTMPDLQPGVKVQRVG